MASLLLTTIVLLSGLVQLLSEHVGGDKRHAGLSNAEPAFTICIRVLANDSASFNNRTAIKNGAIYSALFTDFDVRQDDRVID